MWNGNVGTAKAILLAVSIASLAGCEIDAPSSDAAQGASAPHSDPGHLRYRVDPARNRVWSLTHQGVFVHEGATLRKILVELPAWQWAGEPYGCPPDVALGPKGEVLISSDVVPTLWRIDPQTLAVSVHSPVLEADADKDIGFCALAYSARHGAWFATSLQGSLWRIDPLFRRAQKIGLSEPLPKARSASLKTSRVSGLCLRAAPCTAG